MKICRFDHDRLGLVEGDDVIDVTDAIGEIPYARWPLPLGDPMILNFNKVRAKIEALSNGPRKPLDSVKLYSPIANPGKILGARGGFANDGGKHPTKGYFIKAQSSLIGPSQGVVLRHADRTTFHELEVAVVIGKTADKVSADVALDHVAGYMIGLDLTMIGDDERSTRKSIDTYCVLGPCMVTADEFGRDFDVNMTLSVNGKQRQAANLKDMIVDVAHQIEIASNFYTLQPGDVILAGNPDGSAALQPGDKIEATMDRIGRIEVDVRAYGQGGNA
jgi:2-keto-4-pentenoate hydratase/2-oxohepta-3-ene-1,7-dioic acid hydratase in catechol pathway